MSNKIFFTPGPTQLFYTYQDHLKQAIKDDIPSISHRGRQFQQLFAHTRETLATLLGLGREHEIYFTGSANEIWERIIQNLVRHNSHHFVNGDFARKFYEFATDYQKEPGITEAANGQPFHRLDVPEETELIAVTLNETSNGFAFTEEKIVKLRKAHPDKLIAIDGVSAIPAIPLDFSQIDTAYFSVQKCFGMPAGLGVWIVNERCVTKSIQLEEEKKITGSYHRLSTLRKYGLKQQTPETPNVLGIYILGKIAEDMLARGIQSIRNETTYKSAILYQALERNQSLSPFIAEQAHRSKTVIVADTIAGNQHLLNQAEEKGWILGKGYGENGSNQIRIANFPTHSKEVAEQLADFLDQFDY